MLATLKRDALIYLLPTLLTRGLGLMLLPVYTRYLGPRDYGLIELLTLAFTLLNLVLPLELSQAVARYTPEARTADERSDYFSTTFWFTAAVFAAVALSAAIAPGALSRTMMGAAELEGVLPAAALAMLANALLYLTLNQLRWNLQPAGFAATSMAFSLALAAISIALIVCFDYGVAGYIWGQLGGSVLALALGLALVRRESPLRWTFHTDTFRTMLRFSLPLVVSSLAVYLSSFLDRWIVGVWGGVESMGVYSVAARLASIVAVLVGGVQLALMPLVYRHYRDPGTASSLGAALRWHLAAFGSLALAMAGFAEELVGVLAGPGFLAAAPLVGPLCLAALVASLFMFAPGLPIEKRTGLIAVAYIGGAAAIAVLGVLLTGWFGLQGAAAASLLAGAVSLAIYARLGQRYYPVPYAWRRLLGAGCVLVGSVALLGFLLPPLGWRVLVVGAGIATLAFTLLARVRDAPGAAGLRDLMHKS
jgi:O-antigen/teichoic acid export membrane protein